MKRRLNTLSNQELLLHLESLVRHENNTTAEILAHLIELEARQAYVPLGYSSLFDYCTKKLRYSEPGASRRIRAARCIRDFPEVYELFLARELNLTTICLFAGMLTKENKTQVLNAVKGKSKAEVEHYVAQYKPEMRKRETIRPVSVVKPKAKPGSLQLFNNIKKATITSDSTSKVKEEPCQESFELKFTVGKDFMEKLQRTKVLLSRSLGRAPTLEETFSAAMLQYLSHKDPVERQKRRETKPTKPLATPTKRSRYIPKALADQVLMRKGLCCSYVSADGTRCVSSLGLEIDHITPYARGGTHSADNLRLLCRVHNRLAAEEVYGKAFMNQFRKNGG